MLKRLPLPLALTLLLGGGFLVLVLHLFSLRFDAGDIYPPYSSLRSDPLGARALYESLDGLPDVNARRWLDPGAKMPPLKPGYPGAFLLLGLPHRGVTYLGKADVEVIEDYIRQGGHVVLTFRPISGTGWYDQMQDELEAEKAEKAEKQGRRRSVKKDEDGKESDEGSVKDSKTSRQKKRELENEENKAMVSLTERWGFKFKEATLPKDENGQPTFVQADWRGDSEMGLPAELPWHSSLQFQELSADWQVIYEWKKEPVLVMREWGKGRLTLCADSYLFSNEALKLHRQPAFLAWLMGDAREIYFDESHLGVTQEPGVASLIRKYRLYGVAFALVILAGLFVWRNAFSLVPPEEDTLVTAAQVAGRDAGSGFLNLLFRSVKPKDLLTVAFIEWRRTFRSASSSRADRLKEMESLVKNGTKTNPVELYQRLVKIWKRKA